MHLLGPGLWHDLYVQHFQSNQLLRVIFFSLSLTPADIQLPKWSLRICFLPADQVTLLVMTVFPDCVMSRSVLLPNHLGRFTENVLQQQQLPQKWALV